VRTVSLSDLAAAPVVGVEIADDALSFGLTRAPTADRRLVQVDDVEATLALLRASVAANPHAASALTGLLAITSTVPVEDGLVAESLAYSMLLGAPEFARWRAARPVRPPRTEAGPAVLLDREGDLLTLTLSRPERHNAFSREVRDALVEALLVARFDPDVQVALRGEGPSFCSGGDLDEFGTAKDLAQAHLVRLEQSAGLRVHELADRTTAYLHGACIGAGIEVPAFAGRVVAAGSTRIQLPELGMGLVPGAGGTVSVTKRIGRWRTAYLVLSGATLDAQTACRWGLVDVVRGD
jgi:hypothetical protein